MLRIQAIIVDGDTDPDTRAPIQEFILRSFPIAEFFRPSAPNATYTSIQTFTGANSLTLMFQYRVICSAGTCGSDCSQTTNCTPFPSCVPLTCADSPCLNGGTCSNVSKLQLKFLGGIRVSSRNFLVGEEGDVALSRTIPP